MFNVYSYDKKKDFEIHRSQEIQRSSKSQEKVKAHREKLCENYSKRISDFLFHMEKEPIKINSYQSPIENSGRTTDPSKFKGKPRIIVREYKTHRERLIVFST